MVPPKSENWIALNSKNSKWKHEVGEIMSIDRSIQNKGIGKRFYVLGSAELHAQS